MHSKGANAVEVDVTFGRDGDPLYTYHGPPCDCWRHCHQQEDFHEYLRYVREIMIEANHNELGKNLSLLFLDLKLDYLDHKGKARAGTELAKSILDNLYGYDAAEETEKNPIRLILSVNHVTDVEVVFNFVHFLEQQNATRLMSRIGFDVGMNDDLQQIESMWKKFGNSLNLWQGDGFTNCFSPFYNLQRLSKAILKRDNEQGYPRKVYHWTIDLHDRMRESLRLGVDAIMTNHPERLNMILREPELAHTHRLATRADNPFKKILSATGNSRGSESARYQRSTNANGGSFFASIVDVISSWYAYIREIPFLSLPTTSRLFASSRADKNKKLANVSVSKSTTQTPIVETKANDSSTADSQVKEANSISDSLDQTSAAPNVEQIPYDGPKWYTSFVSNLLVSALKIVLPADR